MQKYEYKIQPETYDPTYPVDFAATAINHWAKEGWELVTVAAPQNTPSHGLAWHYFLRRPVA